MTNTQLLTELPYSERIRHKRSEDIRCVKSSVGRVWNFESAVLRHDILVPGLLPRNTLHRRLLPLGIPNGVDLLGGKAASRW